MTYRHLILFVPPEPYAKQLCALMDALAEHTALPPPYVKLPPHVTFQKPITGADETILKTIAQDAIQRAKPMDVRISHLYPFGKHHIVLPVQTTRALASFWLDINTAVAALPQYERGEYDDENMLHITVAEKTTSVFDAAWPFVKDLALEQMTIPVRAISLWRKPAGEGKWEEIEVFKT